MKISSDITFRIDFEVSISQEDSEPSDFITVYHGCVIGVDEDEEHKIGKVCVYLVEQNRAIEESQSIFEIMDCLDADSCDCFEQLFDSKTEQLATKVECLRSEDRMFNDNLMLLKRLELEPEWRSRGIGKRIALRVIEKLGGSVGLIVCKPFPLQFASHSAMAQHPKGIQSAQKKVREFWNGVGFVPVPGTDYYIWPE